MDNILDLYFSNNGLFFLLPAIILLIIFIFVNLICHSSRHHRQILTISGLILVALEIINAIFSIQAENRGDNVANSVDSAIITQKSNKYYKITDVKSVTKMTQQSSKLIQSWIKEQTDNQYNSIILMHGGITVKDKAGHKYSFRTYTYPQTYVKRVLTRKSTYITGKIVSGFNTELATKRSSIYQDNHYSGKQHWLVLTYHQHNKHASETKNSTKWINLKQ